tara:strand:+ start:1004 stop:1942 length:939 start_codon:yes stop_codon:yes gene_type:complete
MVMGIRELNNYLEDFFRNPIRLEKITTNRTNIVHRCFVGKKKYIIKQYLPYVANLKSVKMHPKRAYFEYKALQLFEKVLGKNHVQKIIHFDQKKYLLILTDEKKDLFFGEEENIEKIKPIHYKKIGELLGKLHGKTINGKNLLNHSPKDYTQYDLLRLFGAKKLYEKEVEQFKKNLKKIPYCVYWADCSPKNIFINKDTVVFIDFEFSYFHAPCLDVGFFLAHILLFMIKHKKFEKKVKNGINIFIKSYSQTILKFGYPSKELDLLLKLANIYSGFILIHKSFSIARYQQYENLKKEIKKFADDLINGQLIL